ncbi:MAG: hypothetical protein J6W49_03390 [Paludibacteraceae bacterium]|nr:hypothetical protein [Paludibacteraceae bacterium]
MALTAMNTATAQNADEVISVNRTYKKIVPLDKFTKEWTIQILSMKRTPQDASFFDGLDIAYEIIGKDGWRRYFIGQYDTEKEANEILSLIRKKNEKYKDAFTVRTSSISFNNEYKKSYGAEVNMMQLKADSVAEAKRVRDSINAEKAMRVFHFAPETADNDKIIESPYKDAEAEDVDERKAYAVQIIASRYPIYKKEIIEFDYIQEFYMPDDGIYRYTTEMCKGDKAKKYLDRAIESGYTEAVIINYNVYKPYLVK